jgi:cytochrome b561
MLTFLNLVQLVLYIALLALIGQGALYVLAGQRRENNVFYKLLQVLGKPFNWMVRKITPRQVADHQVPVVTFCLLAVVYAVVTFERADLCVTQGLVGQPGCR